MKRKIFVLAVFTVAFVCMVEAQPRAIGLNLGGVSGISYQHNLGASNMLDVNVGLPIWSHTYGVGGLQANVTYDWIDPFGAAVPWNNKGSWDWYMGVGAAGGLYGWHFDDAYAAFVGVAGHIGIEYNFWFPLNLSLDYRPSVGVSLTNDGVGFNDCGFYGISLGVRYKF